MSMTAEPVMRRPETPAWLDEIAAFYAQTSFNDLPSEVVSRSKQVIADCIAAIAAGAQEAEIVKLADRRIPKAGPKSGGGVPAIGLSRRGAAEAVAFLGGTAGTMLELDEGNQYARGHPGIHVVPAVLATAETVGKSGREIINAVALGYEIGARIGIASKLRVTMHPHGTWGTVGAAVAVARLNGATVEQMREVINVSSCLGLATSRRTMLEGGTVRNSYSGFSNQLGMTAWDLVASGFTGEADGLTTIYNTVIADQWDPREMTRDLGRRWEIARNYFKRHACCRYNHATIDALERLMREHGEAIKPANIERIDIATYIWAAQLASQEPHNMLAAKFSLPYSVATTIAHGAATVEAFRDRARADATIRGLARKVFVAEDAGMTARLPAYRPARITIHLAGGGTLEAASETNRGDTEDPYTSAEIAAKFMDLAAPVYGETRARNILAAVDALDSATGLSALSDLL